MFGIQTSYKGNNDDDGDGLPKIMQRIKNGQFFSYPSSTFCGIYDLKRFQTIPKDCNIV